MKTSATIVLETLGCKLNQAETESLAGQLLRAGYNIAEDIANADIYLLNTCTVTHIADRKSRHLLRMARRRNPDALIVATGCYAQRASKELTKLEEVDLVIGNGDKNHLPDTIGSWLNSHRYPPRGKSTVNTENAAPVFRTRSQVKIQEGCNRFCSFCIVPYVRGQERSVPPQQVLDEIRARVDQGYKEVTLTGTRIGAYGQDDSSSDANLGELIRYILNETGIARLRLTSLQPQDLTPELIGLLREERLCRHVHLSLQSGCDSTLRRMRRGYSLTDYCRAVSLARKAIPGLAVTTDVIVGFPGETEEEFKESYHFCQRMDFARIHVFPYSPRPGTTAAGMPNQVRETVKRERIGKMLKLAEESAHRFRMQSAGQTVMVLWERETEPGLWSGLSDNYIRVFTPGNEALTNRLLPVRLSSELGAGMMGSLAI